MSLIYLIRHAKPQSMWGQAAAPDPGLGAEGQAQAREAAAWLAPRSPLQVVSSPLARCRETAAPLATALSLPLTILPEVGEIPTPAGLAPDERGPWLRRAFAGRWDQIEGDIDYSAWRLSVAQALAAQPGAAVFSHFVAINAVISLIEGSDAVMAIRPDYASITVLEVKAGRLSLIARGREALSDVL